MSDGGGGEDHGCVGECDHILVVRRDRTFIAEAHSQRTQERNSRQFGDEQEDGAEGDGECADGVLPRLRNGAARGRVDGGRSARRLRPAGEGHANGRGTSRDASVVVAGSVSALPSA